MSLHIYLESPETIKVHCQCDCCGNNHDREENQIFYRGNVTHNLAHMASLANLYKHVWRPEEQEVFLACEMITHLEKGLDELLGNPEKFMELNPHNGWGNYEYFVHFIEEYLQACKQFPTATIKACR